MNVILFDDPAIRENLLPLTYTRPTASIRVGSLTIAEKWARHLQTDVSFSTVDYLSTKFPLHHTSDNLWINGALCPDPSLVEKIKSLQPGEAIQKESRILAVRTPDDEVPEVIVGKVYAYNDEIILIDQLWKIFVHNGKEIRSDFLLLTRGRVSAPITDKATVVYNKENIFLEEGVTLRAAILNADNGPIYLGRNSQVQEGAILRGPFSLGDQSIINMGGKMRADTTIGPGCKVGGEISNSVILGNSNKAHEGFLGNSVLGEWCNLGADTNTSNMKNTYDVVRLWNPTTKDYKSTGLSFCGLIMGDHSKAGINTMFNTGTIAGVSAHIFGAGYPPAFIPSFAWGTSDTFRLDKSLEIAERVMERRTQNLTPDDRSILTRIFELTKNHRTWEK